MIRHRLTDEQWRRIEHLIPGKPGDPGRTGKDNRLFVDAIVWMARTGSPWRDLSPFFGNWNSVWKRFRRWAKAGVWERILAALADDPDFEINHHRWNHRPGTSTCSRRKGGIQEQAIGRSRGGLSTKIHIAVDALGNVLRLLYTAGQTHESTQAESVDCRSAGRECAWR